MLHLFTVVFYSLKCFTVPYPMQITVFKLFCFDQIMVLIVQMFNLTSISVYTYIHFLLVLSPHLFYCTMNLI